MLTKPQTKGNAKTVRFKRRKQKRNPRRLVESVPADWERWDAAAEREGLNWSEFCRRALNVATERSEDRAAVSQKPTPRRPPKLARVSVRKLGASQ